MQDKDWLQIETAPKDGTRILLGADGISTLGWWQDGYFDGVDYMGADAGFVDHDFQEFHPGRSFGNPDSMYDATQPTHWMPIPTPPMEGEKHD